MGLAARSIEIALVNNKRQFIKPRRSERKYRAIIEAAKKVFSQKGFYNARVSDISDQAQIASGTIYLYFKNKDDILATLFDETFRRIGVEIESSLNKCSDSREKLSNFFSIYLNVVGSDKYLAELIHVEMNQATKFMPEYRELYFQCVMDILLDIIDQGIADGVFREDLDSKAVAGMIFGVLDQMCMLKSKNGRGQNTKGLASLIESIFLQGIEESKGYAGAKQFTASLL
ncbi:MAG: TetR/AcrR family transcriptional regulator [Deltaproteobacteria bacterium]|nr:TetR/AcrR family transcriptional regulator [Deltaproteobacteria bacterium]